MAKIPFCSATGHRLLSLQVWSVYHLVNERVRGCRLAPISVPVSERMADQWLNSTCAELVMELRMRNERHANSTLSWFDFNRVMFSQYKISASIEQKGRNSLSILSMIHKKILNFKIR